MKERGKNSLQRLFAVLLCLLTAAAGDGLRRINTNLT
jgi:hypothetical protein